MMASASAAKIHLSVRLTRFLVSLCSGIVLSPFPVRILRLWYSYGAVSVCPTQRSIAQKPETNLKESMFFFQVRFRFYKYDAIMAHRYLYMVHYRRG